MAAGLANRMRDWRVRARLLSIIIIIIDLPLPD